MNEQTPTKKDTIEDAVLYLAQHLRLTDRLLMRLAANAKDGATLEIARANLAALELFCEDIQSIIGH